MGRGARDTRTKNTESFIQTITAPHTDRPAAESVDAHPEQLVEVRLLHSRAQGGGGSMAHRLVRSQRGVGGRRLPVIPICCCYPPVVHRPRVAACSSGRVRAGGGAGCVCVWGVSPWRPGRGWCIASGTPVARSLCAATAAIRSWSLRPGPLLHPSCAGRQHPTRPKQPAAQRKKPWQRSGLGRARGSADLFLSAAISSHSAAHRPSSRPFSYPATLVTKAV